MVEHRDSPVLEEGWPWACYGLHLLPGLSAFLTPQPFKTFHHDVVTPNHRKISYYFIITILLLL